jgi:hypothetical protein
MTESNLQDKIAETITLVIKKANIFEKISELKILTRGMVLFSTVTTTFFILNGLHNNYITNITLQEVKNKTADIENIIENKLEELNKKMDILLHINSVTNLHNLNKNTSFTTNYVELLENTNTNTNTNNSDDELLNECYDNIPCNNIKKATGIKKLFNW